MRIPRAELLPYGEALVGPYIDYCRNVSRRSMALSIESATLFAYLTATRHAVKVLDLGSGFSSYVARCMCDNAVSVDDSPAWLERTGLFLAACGLPADGLMLYADWQKSPGGPYDVIIHDFSAGALREAAMWEAADVLAPGGVLIFDDAQHVGHRAVMRRVIAERGLIEWDVRAETEDEARRYALAAVKS